MLRTRCFAVRLLRLAASATLRPLNPSRVADGCDHRGPRGTQRHVRQRTHARGARSRACVRDRPQHCGLLMQRRGLTGLVLYRQREKRSPPRFSDLVNRTFTRNGPHQLRLGTFQKIPRGSRRCFVVSCWTRILGGSMVGLSIPEQVQT